MIDIKDCKEMMDSVESLQSIFAEHEGFLEISFMKVINTRSVTVCVTVELDDAGPKLPEDTGDS